MWYRPIMHQKPVKLTWRAEGTNECHGGPWWTYHLRTCVEMVKGSCKRVSRHIWSIWSKEIALSKWLNPQIQIWRWENQNGCQKWANRDGLTYQRVPSKPLNALTRNMPTTGKTVSWRVPTSTESSGGPTTQGPGLKHQRDTVNKSASTSVPSNQGRSCHQGDFTPNFEFEGKIIKTDIRVDKNQMDRDGNTSRRVQNWLLDPLTQNMPPTGETDDLKGPICGQNGFLCRNDLETWKKQL